MQGKLICFVGSDGSGKTQTLASIAEALTRQNIIYKKLYFSSLKRRKAHINRFFSLLCKLIVVKYYMSLGRTVLTDRYIELTFQNKPKLHKLITSIFPKPDIFFVMKARAQVLQQRRKIYEGIGDKLMKRLTNSKILTKEQIEEEYKIYKLLPNAVIINTEKSKTKNFNFIMSKISELYKK